MVIVVQSSRSGMEDAISTSMGSLCVPSLAHYSAEVEGARAFAYDKRLIARAWQHSLMDILAFHSKVQNSFDFRNHHYHIFMKTQTKSVRD